MEQHRVLYKFDDGRIEDVGIFEGETSDDVINQAMLAHGIVTLSRRDDTDEILIQKRTSYVSTEENCR